LDKLDADLLKALLVNNGVPPGTPVLRRSFRSIARELGVDQGTVRNRMKNLQRDGVLTSWYLGLSPGVSGSGVVNVWFAVDPALKAGVTERLLSERRVERVCDYLGPKLSAVVIVAKGEEPSSAMKEVAALAGADAVLLGAASATARSILLKETDVAIIGRLRGNPLSSYSSISKALRLSERTVRRRVAKLSGDGTIYALPVLDLKSLRGVIAVELVVDYTSSESRSAVNSLLSSKLGDDIVFSGPSGKSGYFALLARNVSAVDQLAKWVGQQSGVKGARVSILQDVILSRTHYDSRSSLAIVGS